MDINSQLAKKRRNKRLRRNPAKINREYVADAVEDYLKRGGKITEIKPDGRNLQDILAIRDSVTDLDEILG